MLRSLFNRQRQGKPRYKGANIPTKSISHNKMFACDYFAVVGQNG